MIDRQVVGFTVRDDKTSQQELRVRCDMCGVEHDFTVTVEPQDGQIHVTIRSDRPSAMLFMHHTNSIIE